MRMRSVHADVRCVEAQVRRASVLALFVSLVVGLPATAEGQDSPVLVFVVRHAERLDGSPDSPLSEGGRARARVLARTLGDANVSHYIATDRIRTQQTLEALRHRRGGEIQVVPVLEGEGVSRHVERKVELIRSLPPSSVAVVAGHSNTVPRIVSALVGIELDDLPSWEHDRLYVVTLSGQGSAYVSLRFGAASLRP